jgi:hypothetical protein
MAGAIANHPRLKSINGVTQVNIPGIGESAEIQQQVVYQQQDNDQSQT